MSIHHQTTILDAAQVDQPMQWYAMRATYHREMAVKALLDNAGIECYLPITHCLKMQHGRRIRVEIPLVSSLIFVHAHKERLQRLKAHVPHLQYMTTRLSGKNVPIVVPQKQMDDFILITSNASRNLLFFRPGELDLKKGTPIRLHGGTLDGVQGTFVKIAGRRNRRVVVEVEGVVSVAFESKDLFFELMS